MVRPPKHAFTTSRATPARLAVVVLLVLAAGAAASLLAAPPAPAYDKWMHDGASDCIVCHQAGEIRPGICEFCHGGFQTTGTDTCWSCHQPGEDMSAYQTSVGCSAVCHVRRPNANIYDVVFTHGTAPHDGADYAPCLDCHGVSVSFNDPDDSPHHDAVTQQPPTCQKCHDGGYASAVSNHDSVDPACTSCHTGMNIPPQPATCNTCHSAATFGTMVCTDCHSEAGELHTQAVHTPDPTVPDCTTCHSGYTKHAGKVACTTCHAKATAFHHDVTTTAGVKNCTSCHTKKHAGKKVAQAKCATCHKGNAPASKPRAQHSQKITRKNGNCGACHSKALHARALGSTLTCATCHRGRFHGQPTIPTSALCRNCHPSAAWHQVGFACVMCHRSAVHNARPSGGYGVVGR